MLFIDTIRHLLTPLEQEAIEGIDPGDRFDQPHNHAVLNRLVRKGFLWAHNDGTYSPVNEDTQMPYTEDEVRDWHWAESDQTDNPGVFNRGGGEEYPPNLGTYTGYNEP